VDIGLGLVLGSAKGGEHWLGVEEMVGVEMVEDDLEVLEVDSEMEKGEIDILHNELPW
jgi:hypothetical protein